MSIFTIPIQAMSGIPLKVIELASSIWLVRMLFYVKQSRERLRSNEAFQGSTLRRTTASVLRIILGMYHWYGMYMLCRNNVAFPWAWFRLDHWTFVIIAPLWVLKISHLWRKSVRGKLWEGRRTANHDQARNDVIVGWACARWPNRKSNFHIIGH